MRQGAGGGGAAGGGAAGDGDAGFQERFKALKVRRVAAREWFERAEVLLCGCGGEGVLDPLGERPARDSGEDGKEIEKPAVEVREDSGACPGIGDFDGSGKGKEDCETEWRCRKVTFPGYEGLVLLRDALSPALQRRLLHCALTEWLDAGVTNLPSADDEESHDDGTKSEDRPPATLWDRICADGSLPPPDAPVLVSTQAAKSRSKKRARVSTNFPDVPPAAREDDDLQQKKQNQQDQEEKTVDEEDIVHLQTGFPPHTLLARLRWCTLGYHYDWTARSYSREHRSAFPENLARWSAQAVHAATLGPGLAADVSGVGDGNFRAEAAIVNLYRLDTTMGGHKDDVEEAVDAPVVSFSVGNAAVFLVGEQDKRSSRTPLALLLRSGDVLVMAGASRMRVHGVPRVLPDTVPAHLHPSTARSAEEAHELNYLRWARLNVNVRQVYPGPSPSSSPHSSSSTVEPGSAAGSVVHPPPRDSTS